MFWKTQHLSNYRACLKGRASSSFGSCEVNPAVEHGQHLGQYSRWVRKLVYQSPRLPTLCSTNLKYVKHGISEGPRDRCQCWLSTVVPASLTHLTISLSPVLCLFPTPSLGFLGVITRVNYRHPIPCLGSLLGET